MDIYVLAQASTMSLGHFDGVLVPDITHLNWILPPSGRANRGFVVRRV